MTLKPQSGGREARQFGRRETNIYAWIRVPGRSPQNCVVRNLSVGGALIECDNPRSLPYNFELVIESTKVRFACEVRHSSDRSVGVRFSDVGRHVAAEPEKAAIFVDHAKEWGGKRERTVRRIGDAISGMKAQRLDG